MEIVLNICRENLSYCHQNMKKYRFHLLDLTEHVRKKKMNFSTIEEARPKSILSFLPYI